MAQPRVDKHGTNRRRFLKRTLQLASTLAVPAILPRGILGKSSPNERVVIGHVGLGGMGTGHLTFFKEYVGALCDVYEPHLKRAAAIVGRSVPLYKDFRKLLDQKDVDGVLIATPDHWHGVMMIMTCRAGKDVYVQKPACSTIEEGRAMVNAANRWGRIVQVGSQGRSTQDAFYSAQYVQNGQIGRVRHVECWHYPNPVQREPSPDSKPPPKLDWDLWIGPNRWLPYNDQRVHGNFRWMLDFGGGQIRDRGAHVFSVAFFVMNSDYTGPVSVEATGQPPKRGIWDCPPDMDIRYEFKDPDWTLTWSQPGPEELRKIEAGFGARYHGDDGTLLVGGGDGGTFTEEKAKQYKPPPGGIIPYQIRYNWRQDLPFGHRGHEQNWIDCIRSRKQPIMHIESGVRVAALCVLGNLSYRLGRKLRWDPVAERVIGDEAANRLLANPCRAPWRI